MAILATGLAHAQTEPMKTQNSTSPKVIFLDVNETLLDITPLKESVTKALGGQDELVGLWFSTMLHYSLVDQMKVEASEAMLVAAHGWDIAGANAAGFQTVFVARPGKALYPLAEKPDHVVKDIKEFAKLLAKPSQ